MFMAEYGIQELGLLKVIRLSYELLGLTVVLHSG